MGFSKSIPMSMIRFWNLLLCPILLPLVPPFCMWQVNKHWYTYLRSWWIFCLVSQHDDSNHPRKPAKSITSVTIVASLATELTGVMSYIVVLLKINSNQPIEPVWSRITDIIVSSWLLDWRCYRGTIVRIVSSCFLGRRCYRTSANRAVVDFPKFLSDGISMNSSIISRSMKFTSYEFLEILTYIGSYILTNEILDSTNDTLTHCPDQAITLV